MCIMQYRLMASYSARFLLSVKWTCGTVVWTSEQDIQPMQVLHLGGDEVPLHAVKQSPACRHHHLDVGPRLYFMRLAVDIAARLGVKTVQVKPSICVVPAPWSYNTESIVAADDVPEWIKSDCVRQKYIWNRDLSFGSKLFSRTFIIKQHHCLHSLSYRVLCTLI